MRKLHSCDLMRINLTFLFLVVGCHYVIAQSSAPVEHIADKKAIPHAFINATVHMDAHTMLTKAVLLIKDGKIWKSDNELHCPQMRWCTI